MKTRVIDLEKAARNNRLPKWVGRTRLYFLGPRSKSSIMCGPGPSKNSLLFRSRGCKFIRLPNNQFLFFMNGAPDGSWVGRKKGHEFFTKISHELFRICEDKGIKAFYDGLKPPFLSLLEREWKVESKQIGPLYCLPIMPQCSWDALLISRPILRVVVQHGSWYDAKPEKMNGTWLWDITRPIKLDGKLLLLDSALKEEEYKLGFFSGIARMKVNGCKKSIKLDLRGSLHLLFRQRGTTEVCHF